MHRCGKMAAAPVSDVARRDDVRGTPLPMRRIVSSFLIFFLKDLCRLVPIRLWCVSNRTVSDHINIGVFRPKKGNRLVRKKKNLNQKYRWTGLDWILIRRYLRWTEIVSLLLRVLLCFIFLSEYGVVCSFFFFFFGSVL